MSARTFWQSAPPSRVNGSGRGAANAELGSVTLWLLGLCIALLFLGGISLDLWRVFTERRALAGAVDAAAIAGASAIDEAAFRRDGDVRLDPERAEAAAASSLQSQADLAALDDAAVRATPETVAVAATGTVELTLLRVLLIDDDPLQIRVEAVVTPRAG